MTDREKVMSWLEGLSEPDWRQYHSDSEVQEIAKAALVLLLEQEPVEPVYDGYGSYICGNQGYDCGCVGRYNPRTKTIEKYCNFCPSCGRAVKWNES